MHNYCSFTAIFFVLYLLSSGTHSVKLSLEEDQDDNDESNSKDGAKMFNFASHTAGAVILDKSPSTSKYSHLLNDDKDKYVISPCNEKKWVVIGLSEDIMITGVVIANFEKYSSMLKEFQLFAAHSYPSDDWIDLGVYVAEPKLGEQLFNVTTLSSHTRYLKVKFKSHYDSDALCTLSQIKVHGTTVIASFQQEVQWSDTERRDMLQQLNTESVLVEAAAVLAELMHSEQLEASSLLLETPAAEGETKNDSAAETNTSDVVVGDSSESNPLGAASNPAVPDESLQSAHSTESSADAADTQDNTVQDSSTTSSSDVEASLSDQVAEESDSAVSNPSGIDVTDSSDETSAESVASTAGSNEATLDTKSSSEPDSTEVDSDAVSAGSNGGALQNTNSGNASGPGRKLVDLVLSSVDPATKGFIKSLLNMGNTAGNSTDATEENGVLAESADGVEVRDAEEESLSVSDGPDGTGAQSLNDTSLMDAFSVEIEGINTTTTTTSSSSSEVGIDESESGPSLSPAVPPTDSANISLSAVDATLTTDDAMETPFTENIEVAEKVDAVLDASTYWVNSRSNSSERASTGSDGLSTQTATVPETAEVVETSETVEGEAQPVVSETVVETVIAPPLPIHSAAGDVALGTPIGVLVNIPGSSSSTLGILNNASQSALLSANCYDSLRFPEFQAKMIAKLQKSNSSMFESSVPVETSLSASKESNNVFRLLMQRIKALEINNAIMDMYIIQLTECYRTVTKDLKGQAVVQDELHGATHARDTSGKDLAAARQSLHSKRYRAGYADKQQSAADDSGIQQVSLFSVVGMWIQAALDVRIVRRSGVSRSETMEALWSTTDAYISEYKTEIIMCSVVLCCVSLVVSLVLSCAVLSLWTRGDRSSVKL